MSHPRLRFLSAKAWRPCTHDGLESAGLATRTQKIERGLEALKIASE